MIASLLTAVRADVGAFLDRCGLAAHAAVESATVGKVLITVGRE